MVWMPEAIKGLLTKRVPSKTIVGLTEKVYVFGAWKNKEVTARIDTGATKSSIDGSLARTLGIGPVLRIAIVKAAHGISRRPIVVSKLRIAGRILAAEFTIAKRTHMKYRMLIGQNILRRGFLIDPSKGEQR